MTKTPKANTPAARLKRLRKAAGWKTATEFAQKHNFKVSTYAAHEAGDRAITQKTAEDYARALNTLPDLILFGSDAMVAGLERTLTNRAQHLRNWIVHNPEAAKDLPEDVRADIDFLLDPAAGSAGFLADALEKMRHEGPKPPESFDVTIANPPHHPPRQRLPRNVPVMGTAAGSLGEGAFQLETDVVDHVRRPPGIAAAGDVYALYVVGQSMEPRFEGGDLIFVSPSMPAAIGDYVVVQVQNGEHGPMQAYCKRLKKRGPKFLVLEQTNPVATLELANDTVKAVHRILTNNDLYGV